MKNLIIATFILFSSFGFSDSPNKSIIKSGIPYCQSIGANSIKTPELTGLKPKNDQRRQTIKYVMAFQKAKRRERRERERERKKREERVQVKNLKCQHHQHPSILLQLQKIYLRKQEHQDLE
jgi:hypothetical protein